MKVGDVVMFVDEGRYAKWFWGCLATVVRYTPKGRSTGRKRASCRVRWLQPVEYHGRKTPVSDFGAEFFKVISEN